MAFTDQLPALIGVIIGAVGSYTATALTERSRWRRARAERWDQVKREAYTNYAGIVKTQLRLAMRLGAARGFDQVVTPIDLDEGLQQFVEAESKRAAEWESMLLVGDAPTIAAARAWHEAVWELDPYIRGLRDDLEGWDDALKCTGRARDDFYARARKDLGIEGVPPSLSPRPRARPGWLSG